MKKAAKKGQKKPLKASKKPKKEVKPIDVSKIPTKWDSGVEIPLWLRESYATGAIPYNPDGDKRPAGDDASEKPQETRPPAPIEAEGGADGEKMGENEMNAILKEFYRSRAWVAYKQYIGCRLRLVTDSMFSTDPYKEATKMAQQQGIRLGLIDVEGYIVSLLELEKRDVEKNRQ